MEQTATWWKGLLCKALVLTVLLLMLPLGAQPQDVGSYEVKLPSRQFVPAEGIDSGFASRLQTRFLDSARVPYVIVQLKRNPTRQQRETLKREGIELVSSIGGKSWYASLTDARALQFTNTVMKRFYPILEEVRWIGEVEPDDRVQPFLKTVGPGDWATNPDGTIKLSVDFYRTVSREEARDLLGRYGAEIESERTRRVSFYIVVDPAVMDSLAAENAVRYIEIYPPPRTDGNDGSRARTNTDNVHADGVEGDHVVLGIWDGDEVDAAHTDLGARVTFGENPRTNTTSEHATHVAGTMAGDGTNNANLTGHAPSADEIVSYDYFDDVPAEMEQAIEDHEIEACNNSWGYVIGWDNNGNAFTNNQAVFGNYDGLCTDLDDVVREENLIMMFCVMNDRNDPTNAAVITAAQPADWDQGTGNAGFATISPPSTAKNVISVGAIDDATGLISNFSNWGPTDDDRIKPDVVGPGVQIQSCDDDGNDGNPGDVNNQYTFMWGTSMATPAVTGIVALLLETYRDVLFDDITVDNAPLSSTLKALLVHSANDLGRPGPDYTFGWGEVDADAACQLVRDTLMLESQLADAEEQTFLCDVPAGEAEFRVTLCWDDFQGAILHNDLDLTLEDPNGGTHDPWLLDPAPANWANNAGTGADHDNNVEQVLVDNPVAGRWRIIVTGFDITEPAAFPSQKYSLVSGFPFTINQSVSVVQVIDRTGSMIHRESATSPSYMASARTAAQNFIGLMNIGDEAGVVSFDDNGCDNVGSMAEPRFNLAEITDEIVRGNAIASIGGLEDRGCTSIGAGIDLAQNGPNFLDAATEDQPHAMVLLSDGFENTDPRVATVLPGIPAETDIFTVSLGTYADEALLQDIASSTGGIYYESPTVLALLSIYYQIQGDLELGDLVDLGGGAKEGGNDTRYVTIDPGTSEATFAVGWLQEGQLVLELKDPDGQEVTSTSHGATFGSASTHYYVRVPFAAAGDWEVHITRSDQRTNVLDYTFAAFVKDVSRIWSYEPEVTPAGDCLMVKVHLFDNETFWPVRGADVKAIITYAKRNRYTLHYGFAKPVAQRWEPQSVFSHKMRHWSGASAVRPGDNLPKWAATLQTENLKSLKKTGRSIFEYDTLTVTLSDDGTHGDDQANDGVYSLCVEGIEVSGSYNIRYVISGSTPSGDGFTRSRVATAGVSFGQIDPSRAVVRVDPPAVSLDEGTPATITVVPMDRFGNLWGPGQVSRIEVATTFGRLAGPIEDNGDGFYFQKIVATGSEGTGEVTATVDGVSLASRPDITFEGRVRSRWSLSLHLGLALPTGQLADFFDPGLNVLADLDYEIRPDFSVVFYVGYNRFTGKRGWIDDTYLYNFSLNARYRRAIGTSLFGYLQAGPGLYTPETGDTEPGANIGAGFDYQYSGNLTFELGGDFHRVFDPDIDFVHVHAGVVFGF